MLDVERRRLRKTNFNFTKMGFLSSFPSFHNSHGNRCEQPLFQLQSILLLHSNAMKRILIEYKFVTSSQNGGEEALQFSSFSFSFIFFAFVVTVDWLAGLW